MMDKEKRLKELKDGFSSWKFSLDSPEMEELIKLDKEQRRQNK